MSKKSKNNISQQDATAIINPIFLTIAKASKICGIGETTLRKLVAAKEIAYLSVGRKKLITIDAVRAYYERNKEFAPNT